MFLSATVFFLRRPKRELSPWAWRRMISTTLF